MLCFVVLNPLCFLSDATTGGEIAWTCPAVTINSAIYFYEFNIGGLNATWTTRFAIASTAGKTVSGPPPSLFGLRNTGKPWGTHHFPFVFFLAQTTPTNTTAGVEWGTGKLASDATVASASVSGATAGGEPSHSPIISPPTPTN